MNLFNLTTILVIIALFICGSLFGFYLRDLDFKNRKIPETKLENQKSTSFSERTFSSPSQKKSIILKDNQVGSTSVILSKDGKEEEISEGLLIGNINWSPSESKISFSTGTPSAGTTVMLINLNTKQNISVFDDQMHFMEVAENEKYSFGHIYSYDLVWLDDYNLIVGVTGRPDIFDVRVSAKFFLLNAETGKVIKEIL